MSKKELLKTLDIASYSSLVAASVLVLLFEISAVMILIKLSVILYCASFLMLAVLCLLKLNYLSKKTTENDEVLVDEKRENKPWLIVRLVLSVVLAIFMVVMFVMI